MPQLPIAIQLRSLRLPLKKALHAAAQLGAFGVEIDARGEARPQELSDTGRRQLRKFVEDLNLRVAAVEFRTRRGYGVVDDLERRVAATKEAMRLAHDLGASIVVNQIGRVPADPADAEFKLLTDVLADLGAHGDRVGAILAAETGSESGDDLRRLLDAVGPSALGAALNPGNLIVNGHAPLDAIAALGPRIRYVYASDGVRDLARGRGAEVALGRGSVDFPAVVAALEEQGYRGYLTIERQHSEDPTFEIGQAVKYLRSL